MAPASHPADQRECFARVSRPVEAHTREHLEEDELRGGVAGATFCSCLLEQMLELGEAAEEFSG